MTAYKSHDTAKTGGIFILRGDFMKPFAFEDKLVSKLAWLLALACGTNPKMARLISEAALLHDIGKFRTPSHIINKPSGLSPCEYKLMKAHTIWGANMLMNLSGREGRGCTCRSTLASRKTRWYWILGQAHEGTPIFCEYRGYLRCICCPDSQTPVQTGLDKR
jgi:putative nucleotidyltransferase with HDIG domain